MIPTHELQRIDNRIRPQSVVSWTLIGSAYKRGHHMPGAVKLHLSGGGWIWYPEHTPLDQALADADDRGFETATVRARTAHWVRTGV